MTWVKEVLSGVQFALEVIGFMCFITEEALQTGTAGCKNAIIRKKYDLAQQMLDEVLVPANNELFMWVIIYGIGIYSGWEAYLTYWLAQRNLNDELQLKIDRMRLLEKVQSNKK